VESVKETESAKEMDEDSGSDWDSGLGSDWGAELDAAKDVG
jgi:hypothetical protein